MKYNFDIIIPTRNRFAKLTRLIDSIYIAFPLEIRPNIIVVDDGSFDKTTMLYTNTKQRLVVFHIKHSGAAKARNIGIAHSKNEYILMLDDDCVLPQTYRWHLFPRLKIQNWDLCGGKMLPITLNSKQMWKIELFLRSISFFEKPYKNNNDQIRCIPSGHFLVRKKVFDSLQGFDERFTVAAEDNNFTERARRKGYRIVYDEDLFVYHEHPTTPFMLSKKFFYYGYGNSMNCRILGLKREECGLLEHYGIVELSNFVVSMLKNSMYYFLCFNISFITKLAWFFYSINIAFFFQCGAIYELIKRKYIFIKERTSGLICKIFYIF